MEALLKSWLLVAASEMGDKTQLLALVLAVRFKRPWVIMAGILCATLLNHGLASWLGGYVSTWLSPSALKYTLAAIFGAFALWILIPDKDEEGPSHDRFGPFLTTLVTFALGARFASPVWVTIGTTLGMLTADGLAVVFGEKLTEKIPMNKIRIASSVLFALFGVGILLEL